MLQLPYPFKQLFRQTAEIPSDLWRGHGVVQGFAHLTNLGYGTPGGLHLGEAVSQAHIFVLILHSSGELHTKPMTLSVQHFWFEPQLITKMQLLQNFRQLAESLRGVIVVASGEIGRRRSDNRLLWERQPIRCKFVEQDDKTSDFWGISFPSNA